MSLFKPSAKKVVETIFSEFTPEEKEILNSNIFPFPYMYNTLIHGVCPIYKSKYSLSKAKRIAKDYIFPYREDLEDLEIRKKIFSIFIHDLLTITNKQNHKPLWIKDAVKLIFDFIKKISPSVSLKSLEKHFRSYLIENNLQPFTNNKDIFLTQVECLIFSWSEDIAKDKIFPKTKDEFISNVLFPFIDKDLKNIFVPIPPYKSLLGFLNQHHNILMLFSSVFTSITIFCSLI